MQSMNQRTSTKPVWAGRLISALIALFMVFDGVIKVMRLAPAVEGTAQLGYPAGSVVGIGIAALVCTVVYVIGACQRL